MEPLCFNEIIAAFLRLTTTCSVLSKQASKALFDAFCWQQAPLQYYISHLSSLTWLALNLHYFAARRDPTSTLQLPTIDHSTAFHSGRTTETFTASWREHSESWFLWSVSTRCLQTTPHVVYARTHIRTGRTLVTPQYDIFAQADTCLVPNAS